MSGLKEDSYQDRLIEEYLFSGYKPARYKTTFDMDQQFAKPIEDEDLFGVDESSALTTGASQPRGSLDCDDPLRGSECGGRESPRLFAECEDGLSPSSDHSIDHLASLDYSSPIKARSPEIDADQLFEDSISSTQAISPLADENPQRTPRSGDCGSEQPTQVDPSPARIKALQMRQKIKEQAIAMGLVPTKFAADRDGNGFIEIDLNCKGHVPESRSRIIFDKLLKKSTDRKNSPHGGGKLTWDIYSNVLRKKICSDKRKIWDSFQHPTDNYDDEEEMIVSTKNSPSNSPRGSPDNGFSSSPTPSSATNDQGDESDNEFAESNESENSDNERVIDDLAEEEDDY